MNDLQVQTNQLKQFIANNYMKQIQNFFKNENQAMKFMSSVIASVQRNPKLLECQQTTLMNAFMTMAQLELMPSDVSGEAYVLPYNTKNGMQAQFQLGYQGMVTLFYRAGAKEIVAEIVHENDEFSVVNGKIHHNVDYFSERGDAIGAYVIVTLGTGGSVQKVMSKKEIIDIAKKYSKSYGSKMSPWKSDPQLWMWKKTVLRQVAKLVPKNEIIVQAIAHDDQDSKVDNKLADKELEQLKMGAIEVPNNNETHDYDNQEESDQEEGHQNQAEQIVEQYTEGDIE